MMFYCKRCREMFGVDEDDPTLEHLGKRPKCPNVEECSGRMVRWEKDLPPNYQSLTSLTGQDLYAAAMGGGLPWQRQCAPRDLKSLEGKKVISIDCKLIKGTSRSVVSSLVLEGGLRVHLATSTHGATVYKITGAPSPRRKIRGV